MGTIENPVVIKDESADGLTYRIDIEPDYDSTPDDADCYTAAQKAAWRHDEWSYVGVIVTPVIEGILLDSYAESLGGCEYGTFTLTDEQDNVTGATELDLGKLASEYPGPDLISAVRRNLASKLGPVIDALRKVQEQL